MAVDILYNEPEMVIALYKKAIFVNPDDLQIFKEIELPENLDIYELKTVRDDHHIAVNEATSDKQKEKVSHKEELTIQNVCLSYDRELFAISTSGEKAVLLYKCRPEHGKLLSVRSLNRASSAMCFSSDAKLLLVMDKTGDCYGYDCVDEKAEPRLLFGHMSIVYGLLWTNDQKFIISSDRDDKIRVTKYPETYDIHGYCLGHTEFVSALAFLEDKCLMSISGDKSLRIWNYDRCKELGKWDLPAPGLRLSVRKLVNSHFQAAVLLYQPEESVIVYDIRKCDDKWEVSEGKIYSFPSMVVVNLSFVNERLFVVGSSDDCFAIDMVEVSGTRQPPENWLPMIREQFAQHKCKLEDVSSWFKKRYDNVSDYLERKKRRIEEKKSSK